MKKVLGLLMIFLLIFSGTYTAEAAKEKTKLKLDQSEFVTDKDGNIKISGSTDKKAKVTIDGKNAKAKNGEFSYNYKLKKNNATVKVIATEKGKKKNTKKIKIKKGNKKKQTVFLDRIDSSTSDEDLKTYIEEQTPYKVEKINRVDNGIAIQFKANDKYSCNQMMRAQSLNLSPILKLLKGSDLKDILFTSNAILVDNKGNENSVQGISTMYSIDTINQINFDNWIDQVQTYSQKFFETADVYLINLSVYNELTDKDYSDLSDSKGDLSQELFANFGM